MNGWGGDDPIRMDKDFDSIYNIKTPEDKKPYGLTHENAKEAGFSSIKSSNKNISKDIVNLTKPQDRMYLRATGSLGSASINQNKGNFTSNSSSYHDMNHSLKSRLSTGGASLILPLSDEKDNGIKRQAISKPTSIKKIARVCYITIIVLPLYS